MNVGHDLVTFDDSLFRNGYFGEHRYRDQGPSLMPVKPTGYLLVGVLGKDENYIIFSSKHFTMEGNIVLKV